MDSDYNQLDAGPPVEEDINPYAQIETGPIEPIETMEEPEEMVE